MTQTTSCNKHPAAFINMISEGKNFDECLNALQETWNELRDQPKWRTACKKAARTAYMYRRRWSVAQTRVDDLEQKLKEALEVISTLKIELNEFSNRRD